jgi:Xaa-Pro aminopeptidase
MREVTSELALELEKHSLLQAEVSNRLNAARSAMAAAGFSALLVYGDNKLYGSLRYLSGVFPDRAGWISPTADIRFVFEGGLVLLPIHGEPTLLLEPGLTLAQEPCIADVRAGGLGSTPDQGLTPQTLVNLIRDKVPRGVIGIEALYRFPTGLYVALVDQLSDMKVAPSTVIEDLRLIKSAYEIEILRKAAAVGDRGHEVMVKALTSGKPKSEQELMREVEYSIRLLDPIYEDSSSAGPGMICSGPAVGNSLLYPPQPDRRVGRGDVIHWDIAMRHRGYTVDTSRTRVLGKANPHQKRAFEAVSEVMAEVMAAIRPGLKASELVDLAVEVSNRNGYELWARFLGHGTGLDGHERPDMGREDTPFAAGMVVAIEPRLVQDDRIFGIENTVLVTPTGAETLNRYPAGPLELL